MAPQYALDDHAAVLEAMASESVVQLRDDLVQFFHESFFDYAFARTFLGSNNDLVAWLVADSQHLFRRSQVRQILEFLRSREPDRRRYLRTLEGLLRDRRIRFHIKKLVLDWLGQLPDPVPEEWRILEGMEQEFEAHVWSVVRNRLPWFDLLQELGLWALWLDSDVDQIERAVWLLGMPDVLDARATYVAALVARFRDHSESWRKRLRWLAMRGHGYASPEWQDLAIRLIADGTLDDAKPGSAPNDDLWQIFDSVAAKEPSFVTRILGSWFDRQLACATDRGSDDPFQSEPWFAPESTFCSKAIKECATRAPNEFVWELFPRFASFDQLVPRDWIDPPSRFGSPEEQLRDALADAMGRLASSDPNELDSVISATDLSDTTWMSALVMQAWCANAEVYAERIARFLLARPKQRLCIGYGMWNSETDGFVAISRTAGAAASAHCSAASLRELVDAILHFTPDWEPRYSARRPHGIGAPSLRR